MINNFKSQQSLDENVLFLLWAIIKSYELETKRYLYNYYDYQRKIASGEFHDFACYAVRFHVNVNNTKNPPKDYKFRLCVDVMYTESRVACPIIFLYLFV